jgi:hypothetical protein
LLKNVATILPDQIAYPARPACQTRQNGAIKQLRTENRNPTRPCPPSFTFTFLAISHRWRKERIGSTRRIRKNRQPSAGGFFLTLF